MTKTRYYILLGLVFGTLTAGLVSFTSLYRQPMSYADAVDKAAPSVVNIYTTKITQPVNHNFSNDPFLNYFLNQRQKRYQQKRELSLGSGVIVSNEGFILTNYHVIKDAEEILVLLYDGRETLANVIGIDKDTDLAVLRINLDDISAIDFSTFAQLRVGDMVLAIGNPYGFGQTVTAGIISATGRYGLNLNTYENFIQTDAAINVGSSGGALINTRGQLVGINAAIYSQTGGSQGIGLAIPVDIAAKVMTDIIHHGQVIRGWLGLEVIQLTPALATRLGLQQTSGIVISNIYQNSPADLAGLKPTDIISSIDGKKIKSGQDGLLEVANLQPGKAINVEIIRNNKIMAVSLTVGIRPSRDG